VTKRQKIETKKSFENCDVTMRSTLSDDKEAPSQGSISLAAGLDTISLTLQRLMADESTKAEATNSLNTMAMILENILKDTAVDKRPEASTSSARSSDATCEDEQQIAHCVDPERDEWHRTVQRSRRWRTPESEDQEDEDHPYQHQQWLGEVQQRLDELGSQKSEHRRRLDEFGPQGSKHRQDQSQQWQRDEEDQHQRWSEETWRDKGDQGYDDYDQAWWRDQDEDLKNFNDHWQGQDEDQDQDKKMIQQLQQQIAEVQRENCQLKEEQGKEFSKTCQMRLDETRAKEGLHSDLQRWQSEVREKQLKTRQLVHSLQRQLGAAKTQEEPERDEDQDESEEDQDQCEEDQDEGEEDQDEGESSSDEGESSGDPSSSESDDDEELSAEAKNVMEKVGLNKLPEHIAKARAQKLRDALCKRVQAGGRPPKMISLQDVQQIIALCDRDYGTRETREAQAVEADASRALCAAQVATGRRKEANRFEKEEPQSVDEVHRASRKRGLEEEEMLPHRRGVQPLRSALRKTTGIVVSNCPRRIHYEPRISQIHIATYKACGEDLWYQMPGAFVLCEGCDEKVLKENGQLKGALTQSRLAWNTFLCSSCAALPRQLSRKTASDRDARTREAEQIESDRDAKTLETEQIESDRDARTRESGQIASGRDARTQAKATISDKAEAVDLSGKKAAKRSKTTEAIPVAEASGSKGLKKKAAARIGDSDFEKNVEVKAGDKDLRKKVEDKTGNKDFRKKVEDKTGNKDFRKKVEDKTGGKDFKKKAEINTGGKDFQKKAEIKTGDKDSKRKVEAETEGKTEAGAQGIANSQLGGMAKATSRVGGNNGNHRTKRIRSPTAHVKHKKDQCARDLESRQARRALALARGGG
jgi:hypothetical protein